MRRWIKQAIYGCLAALIGLSVQPSTADAREMPTVVVVGDDSLIGTGLAPNEESFMKIFERQAHNDSTVFSKIVNLSRTGETADSLVQRVNEILSYKPVIVVIGVGLNDAIAQAESDVVFGNLESVLNMLYNSRVNVLLMGIKAPSSLPDEYELRFNRIYADLATRYKVYFIPNLMDGIFFDQKYSQKDGVLPSAEGVKKMYESFSTVFRLMLKDYNGLRYLCDREPNNPACNMITPVVNEAPQ